MAVNWWRIKIGGELKLAIWKYSMGLTKLNRLEKFIASCNNLHGWATAKLVAKMPNSAVG